MKRAVRNWGRAMDKHRARKADPVAAANFLASLAGMSQLDAFANLRADTKAYGWNAATNTAIAEGIGKHFAPKSAPIPLSALRFGHGPGRTTAHEAKINAHIESKREENADAKG